MPGARQSRFRVKWPTVGCGTVAVSLRETSPGPPPGIRLAPPATSPGSSRGARRLQGPLLPGRYARRLKGSGGTVTIPRFAPPLSAPMSRGPAVSDPYAEWLDIPAHLRPPTHYQLLGIPPSELDPRAIVAAADRRLARLREHATGPRGDDARRLAREVVEARDTLVDPVTRLTYDTLAPDAADP